MNTWGDDLREDLSYYKQFAADEAWDLNHDNSAWQLTLGSANNYTRASASKDGNPHFYACVWRMASALQTVRFKVHGGETYYGHIGHRWWNKTDTGNAIAFKNTETIDFLFESASSLATATAASCLLGLLSF